MSITVFPIRAGVTSAADPASTVLRVRLSSLVRRAVSAAATVTLVLAVAAKSAQAQDLSTHVLDLAQGVGSVGVPVKLEQRVGEEWREVSRAVTDSSGRVRAFTGTRREAGVFRLTFDMRAVAVAPASGAKPRPFFPEIVVVFEVPDTAHYHVPVVVSPFGYSTYRGN